MRFGIVVFPGSNCDHDAYHAVAHVLGEEARFLWHKDPDLKGSDAVILPGGFSYGDYLRCGAIAARSPVMSEVVAFARKGGPVLGICNGFQVLVEAQLLPGALMRNESMEFVCRDIWLAVENPGTRFTGKLPRASALKMPVAHAEGNFTIDPEGLERLQGEGRIAFRYVSPEGLRTPGANPNGSLDDIAGVLNAEGNVMGLMPHPERACESLLGSTDGLGIFRSLCG